MSGRMAVVWNRVVPLKTRSKSTVGSGDLRQIFNIWRSLTHFPVSDGLVKLRTCSTRGLYILAQYERKISISSSFLTGWKLGPLLSRNIQMSLIIFHFWGWFLDSPKNSFYWIFFFHIAPECRAHVYYKFWDLQVHRTQGSGSTNAKCRKSAFGRQILLPV